MKKYVCAFVNRVAFKDVKPKRLNGNFPVIWQVNLALIEMNPKSIHYREYRRTQKFSKEGVKCNIPSAVREKF